MIIFDHGKGGLGYIQGMIDAARDSGIPVVVDPKGAAASSAGGTVVATLAWDELAIEQA